VRRKRHHRKLTAQQREEDRKGLSRHGLLGHAHRARLGRGSERGKDCCKNQFNDEVCDDIYDNFCDQTPKHLRPPLRVHDRSSNCYLKPTNQASVELVLSDLLLLFYYASIKELLSRCYILLACLALSEHPQFAFAFFAKSLGEQIAKVELLHASTV
jgi:hypothetical protein